jgi:hypothetical protein
VKAWFDDISARKSWQKIAKEYINESWVEDFVPMEYSPV